MVGPLKSSWVMTIVLAVSGPLFAQSRIETNVVYGMYSGLALLMDVHRPENPNGYGIIVIPGSGWHASMSLDAGGLKSRVNADHFGLDRLLERGYTLFSINHRAAPRFRYPAAVEDAQRAVRFIRHHAEAYGVRPDRIGAFGGSSGGHLVSMLGVLDGDPNPDAASPVDRESAKVQAVAALFPPTDFVAFATGNGGSKEVVSSFLGTPYRPQEGTVYTDASPIHYVSRDDAPVLLVHGDRDPVVPFGQSELFHAELTAVGVPVRLIPVPGGGHGASLLDGENTPDYFDPMVTWFDRHLRNIE